MNRPLTEQEIELKAGRAMDRLDARLMSGRLSQSDYNREVSTLDKWLQAQYDAIDCGTPPEFSDLRQM
jgi:hypothetical protein